MTEDDFTGRLTTTELRRWRELNKITQKQMAEWLGTSRPTYLRFENSLHRKAPRDNELEIRASELTGIPANELHHKYIRRRAATYPQREVLNFDFARTLVETVYPFPHYLKDTFFGRLLLEKRRRRKRRRERQWSDFWGGEKEITSLPEWQKIELDIVEWAAFFETIRQQRRKIHKKSVISPRNSEAEVKDAIDMVEWVDINELINELIRQQRRKIHKKSVISPRNSEAEVKDAIENYLSRKPLTVLEYNRLDRLWSQQKVATEIGISQSQYSKIERRICKATNAELDKLERLFGISKIGLFLPWDMQHENVYRLATGGKNKPGEIRHLAYNDRSRISLKESPRIKIPWYELRFRLVVDGLSPFRVLMLHKSTKGDVSELLFRGR